MHLALVLCTAILFSAVAGHREVVIGSNEEEFYRPTIVVQQRILRHYGITSRVVNTINGAPYPQLKEGKVDLTTGFWTGNGNYIDQYGYRCTGPVDDYLVGIGWSYKGAGLTWSVPDYVNPSITSLANFAADPQLAKSFKGPIVTFGKGTALEIGTRKALSNYSIDTANPGITVLMKSPAEMYDYIYDHYEAKDEFFIVGTMPRNFNDKLWKVRPLEDPNRIMGDPQGQAAVMWASKTSNIMNTLPSAAAEALQRVRISVADHAYLGQNWLNTGNGTVSYQNNYTKCEAVVEEWLKNTAEGRMKWDEWINGPVVKPNPTNMSFDEFLSAQDLPQDPNRGAKCLPPDCSCPPPSKSEKYKEPKKNKKNAGGQEEAKKKSGKPKNTQEPALGASEYGSDEPTYLYDYYGNDAYAHATMRDNEPALGASEYGSDEPTYLYDDYGHDAYSYEYASLAAVTQHETWEVDTQGVSRGVEFSPKQSES